MNQSDYRAELVRRMRNPVPAEPTFHFGKHLGETVTDHEPPAEMGTTGSEFQFEDLDMLLDDPMEIWCSMEPWGDK